MNPETNMPEINAETLKSKLGGVFAPIATPFSEDEEVDYAALEFNLERYAASGILGYLALGSNGENRSLTEEEKLRVLELIVRRKGRGQVVLAGATYDAQRDTERFLKQAAGIGADFGLVLSPGYFRKQMTEEVLYRYFSTLADASPIPLLLYNAPGFCGVTLTPALVGRLAAHPNIVGMKDSAPSGIENFLKFESEKFHVLAGSANFLFPAMLGGALGGTVSLANAFPEFVMELFRCGQARDQARGYPLQERVTRINSAISGSYGVAGVKAAMNLAGYRAASRAARCFRSRRRRWMNCGGFLSRRGCCRETGHSQPGCRHNFLQAGGFFCRVGKKVRGEPRLSGERVRPGQGGYRTGEMVAGFQRVLPATAGPAWQRGRGEFVGDHARSGPYGGGWRRPGTGNSVFRRPLARAGAGHPGQGRRREVPEGDLQPAGFGWLLVVFHNLDQRESAGGLSRCGQIRTHQYLHGEAADRPVDHRSVYGLDHRALQHGRQ